MEIKNYFAQDASGNVMPGARVDVFFPGTTSPVTTLQNAEGGAKANPFFADAKGLIQFAAPNGLYDLKVTSGMTSYTIKIQCADLSDFVGDAQTAASMAEDEADRAEQAANSMTYSGTGAGGTVEDYAAGIEVTAYNQIIRADGEFWKLTAATDLPYTTTGAGMPEGGAFVSVGDAALRQSLANPTDPALGAALVGAILPDGTASNAKTAINLLESTQAEALSLKNSDLTLAQALAGGGVVSLDRDETVTSRITIADRFSLSSDSYSRVYQETPKTSVFSLGEGSDHTVIEGLVIAQFKESPPGTGLLNDHPVVSCAGAQYPAIISNQVDGEIGISFAFGPNTMADRRTLFGLAAFNVGTDIWGMYLENIACSYTRLVGNALNSTTRGNSIGIRLTGYDQTENPGDSIQAPCHGIVGTSNVFKNISYGISYQSSSKFSNINGSHLTDMIAAVHTAPGTSEGNFPTLHRTDFTADKVEKGIYNVGMNHSRFGFHVDGADFANNIVGGGPYGVEEITSVYAGKGFNHYDGLIKNAGISAFINRYSHTLYNLQISGVIGSGAFINGNYGNGSITVDDVSSNGILVGGSNNNLSLVATNCGVTAVGVSGSNNNLNIVTDGNISVTGTGNTISGQIAGTITKVSGNDFTGVKGFSGSAFLNTTLNSSGQIAITTDKHPSASIYNASVLINSNPLGRTWKIVSASGALITIAFFDSAGAPLGAETIGFSYSWIGG